MPLNAWTHIAFTYSASGTLIFYVDGSASSSYSAGASGLAGGTRVNGIGAVADNGDHTGPTSWFYSFQGTISQVRYFNSVLTQANVNTLYGESASDNDTLDILGDGKCIAAYTLSKELSEVSIISANANAGMSIVKYEGNGVAGTKVPHGLSAAPDMVIAKGISGGGSSWWVQHSSLAADKVLELNGTAAQATYSSVFNNTAATSTVVTLGSGDTNRSGETQILLLFPQYFRYQKFGSYAGNGTTQTINVGFQPDFVMIKAYTNSTSNTSWTIIDSVRHVSSSDTNPIYANLSAAEGTRGNGSGDGDVLEISFTSTGFKLGDTGSNNGSDEMNDPNNDYIYWAIKIN